MITRKGRARALIRLSTARRPRHSTTLPTPWGPGAQVLGFTSGQIVQRKPYEAGSLLLGLIYLDWMRKHGTEGAEPCIQAGLLEIKLVTLDRLNER